MFDAHFILLHVDSPAASARFYADLLGSEPLEQSPTFAMFALPSGLRLGLWSVSYTHLTLPTILRV